MTTLPVLKHPSLAEARISAVLRTYHQIAKPIFLVVLGLWLSFNLYQTISHILDFYMPLPVWDYWRVVENLEGYRHFDFPTLWKQHNEHRIFFPKLVYAADVVLCHGRQILPLAVGFLSYVAFWLTLSWTLLKDRSLTITDRAAAILVAGVITLWPGSAVVLATPFLLQWSLLLLAVTSSLFFLSRVPNSSSGAAMAASIGLAAVATYTSGNGFALWPVLLLGGWILQIGRRRIMILALSAVVIIGFYFVDYTFSHDLNLRNLLTHPVYSLEFIGAYLGMPFSVIKAPQFGVCIGLGALSVTMVLGVIAAREGLLAVPPAVVLFGFYLFCLLSAILVAAGRMDVSDPVFIAAKAARYSIVPLANWGAFVLLCLWITGKRSRSFISPSALTLAISLLLMVYLPKLRPWLLGNANEFAEQQVAMLSIEDGLTDPTLMKRIYPDRAFLANLIPRLQQNRFSSWYQGHSRWVGQPVERYSRVSKDRLPGQVTDVFPLQTGIEVTGWADDSQLRAPYRWVVLADQAQNIVGFGERIPAGFPWSLKNLKTPTPLGWVGFISLRSNPTEFSAYVVDSRRGGLFPLAGSIPLPNVRNVALSDAGAALKGLSWTDDLKSEGSMLPTKVDFGAAPAASIQSSWRGTDANFGKIVSAPFPAPENACIVIPILHGPSTNGLAVSLLDGQTGSVVADIPLRDADLTWQYWQMPLSRSIKTLKIVARDQGRGWGQWLAVSDPLACR